MSNQFLHGLCGQVWSHYKNVIQRNKCGYRPEGLDWVVARIGGETEIMPIVDEQQAVTIGIGSCDGLSPDRHATTWPIVDENGLTKTQLHLLGEYPAKRVHRRARRYGRNELDGPGGIGLRLCRARQRRNGADACQ